MSAHPPLQLDPRQRAMLAEMGVRVWLPEDASPIPQEPALAHAAPTEPAPAATHIAPKASPARAALAPAVAAPAASQPAFKPGPPPQVQTLEWPALTQAAATCQACAMCQGRKNTVLHAPAAPGQTADWLVVGEAPDEEEDRQGLAFVGDAGVLLDNMLAALGVKRLVLQGQGTEAVSAPVEPAHSAYLSHALQCRPPAGRSPQLAEVSVCRAFLEREIALVRPKVILAMGRLAALAVLSDQPALLAQPMGKQRGTLHRFQGIPVVITYSPHYLLRNSADKAKAWLDLNLAADALESA
jgi:DNA polymerase